MLEFDPEMAPCFLPVEIWAEQKSEKHPLPIIVGEGGAENFDFKDVEDDDVRESLTKWANNMAKGAPFP